MHRDVAACWINDDEQAQALLLLAQRERDRSSAAGYSPWTEKEPSLTPAVGLRAWARRCRGGYHARSLTDGVPVRSMKQLFELALQLEPPWRVVSSDFDFARRRVELRLGFRTGARFPCPQCGRACHAVKFTEGTWRQPDVMAFEASVTARLPSIRCPEHGDVALAPSWASDHMSLRGLIRGRTTDQLGGTSADPSSRGARPPESSGRAGRRPRR
jgi:hypothetical protein